MPIFCPSPRTKLNVLHPVEKVMSFHFTCAISHSNDLLLSVLIAADDALKSAIEAGNKTSEQADLKFREVIHLLSGFEKDFPSNDSTLDPNFGGTDARKAKSDKSESPLTILRSLKENLQAKVNFPSVSSPLNADADES
jgi:hypothetical protein